MPVFYVRIFAAPAIGCDPRDTECYSIGYSYSLLCAPVPPYASSAHIYVDELCFGPYGMDVPSTPPAPKRRRLARRRTLEVCLSILPVPNVFDCLSVDTPLSPQVIGGYSLPRVI